MSKSKIWIIKGGGELFVQSSTQRKILKAIRARRRFGQVILVHGGGPQIAAGLKKNHIKIKFVNGRRYTSPQAISVVEQVLSGEINKGLTAELNKIGVPAVGLSCRDGKIITGKAVSSLGRAGYPKKVNPKLLQHLLKGGFVPVISTIGSDSQGKALNINADDAASALATALKAHHLVFLTNVLGVLDHKKRRIPTLTATKIKSLIKKGVISGGMIPKVQSALAAIRKGVKEVDILKGTSGIDFKNGTRIFKND